MDRRWSERRPVEVEVEVYCCGRQPTRRLLRARTRDLSFGGAFLLTDDRELPRYREVLLRFPCRTGPGRQPQEAHCTVRGHAVYHTDEGVAVRFDRIDLEVVRALRDLLRDAPRRLSA